VFQKALAPAARTRAQVHASPQAIRIGSKPAAAVPAGDFRRVTAGGQAANRSRAMMTHAGVPP
jgi:hypothetical protein